MNRSILIADDEELIRQGIKARLEYLNMKPDRLYEAEGALQAIELVKEHDVDIIITDIRMADMDGLALIRQVKALYPKIQFIVLTGYAEFEYAEQAIQLGVRAYLLKPVSNDALKKALNDAMNIIDENKKMQETVREGARSIAKNRIFLFEKAVNELLQSVKPQTKISNMNEIICSEIPLKSHFVMVAVINIDTKSYEQNHFEYKDIELVKFSIKNIFNELQSTSKKTIVNNLVNRNQMFAIISCKNKEQVRNETEKLFINFLNIMRKMMKISLTIGISEEAEVITTECNEQAQEAISQRLIHGKENIYFYDDIKILTATQFPASQLHMLRKYIERHDVGNIEFLINDIFSNENIKMYNASYIRIIWTRVINILLSVVNPTNIEELKNMERLVTDFGIFDSFDSIEELRSYLYMQILNCIQSNTDTDLNAKNKIKMGIKYIQDNYNKDIAINELAEKFSISPNYFSTIFKKETGQTTINYIKNLRIEKACEYLIRSDRSVVDISTEVGYEDSQYFFRVFKKMIGLTPLEYRRIHRN